MRLRAYVDEGGPGGHGWGVATALQREDLRFLVGLALCAWCSGRVLQVEDRGVRSEGRDVTGRNTPAPWMWNGSEEDI
jgi:hypothetical protein